MSNIVPILRREYITRIRTKGFWISTLIVPIFLIAIMFVPILLAEKSKPSRDPIVIVDLQGDFYPVLEDVLKKSEGKQQRPSVVQEPANGRSAAQLKRELNIRAEGREQPNPIQGYLIVEPAGLEAGELVYFARNPSGAVDDDWFRNGVRVAVTRYRLTKLGLNGAQIDTATKRVGLDVQRATNDPKKQQSGISAIMASLVMTMFIYTTLIFYGIYVMRGVLEEKTNRIVEIIVSSVKPFDLMMGKIFGIGAVGLTQILIWVGFGLVVSAPQLAVGLSISRDVLPKVSPVTLAFFPVYFLLGYFLYATIYAGIGSMFNSEEDAQQMQMLPTLLIVVAFVMFSPVMRNPNGTLAVVLSLIPFFTPLLMFLRIAVETPPAWQIALSVGIMIGTTLLMTWLVGKIYRVGILMYGKKPTFPELARWLRYA